MPVLVAALVVVALVAFVVAGMSGVESYIFYSTPSRQHTQSDGDIEAGGHTRDAASATAAGTAAAAINLDLRLFSVLASDVARKSSLHGGYSRLMVEAPPFTSVTFDT